MSPARRAQAQRHLLGTNGMDWNFPLFERPSTRRWPVRFRDLDQDMEVLDYSGNVHEIFHQPA
jgi:hypothetical protein